MATVATDHYRAYTPRPFTRAERDSVTILFGGLHWRIERILQAVLEGSGYRVLEARQAGHALEIAEDYAGPIHLLVTDVVMPKMGGRELARRLTALRPGLRVLFSSGYTEHAIVEHGVLDEGVEFLQKPYTPVALARRVREVLDM
jgi:CheY-like chemotaxis protein